MRNLIGLLASQILVLQFFLAGAVATEMAFQAPPNAFAICHGNGPHSSGQPDRPDAPIHHGVCAICAFAAHAAPVPAGTADTAIFDARTAAIGSVAPPAVVRPEHRSPRTSQGPPPTA